MKEDRTVKQTYPSSGETGTENTGLNKTSTDGRCRYRRREFLGRVMGVTAMSMVGLPVISAKNGESGQTETGPKAAQKGALPKRTLQRRDEAYKIRYDAAVFEKDQPLALHPDNGDET